MIIENKEKKRLEQLPNIEIGVIAKQIINGEAQQYIGDEHGWYDIAWNYASSGMLNIDFKGIYRTKPKALTPNELYKAVRGMIYVDPRDQEFEGMNTAYVNCLELITQLEGYKE